MLEDQRSSKYVLAIDLGTGGPKVGLVDQQGQVAQQRLRSGASVLSP